MSEERQEPWFPASQVPPHRKNSATAHRQSAVSLRESASVGDQEVRLAVASIRNLILDLKERQLTVTAALLASIASVLRPAAEAEG